MGKILIVVLVGLVFVMQGCEAFKSSYDSPPQEVLESMALPEGAEIAGDESATVEDEIDTGATVVDYSVDTTECEPNPQVSVALVSDQDETVNDGWTTEGGVDVTVTAEKLGAYTTAVTISNDSGKLSYTIKQVADDTFNVCDVTFEGDADAESFGMKSIWSEVKEALIDVYKFNQKGKEDTVVNAGHYNITFDKSNMGDPGETLEGSYTTDELVEQTEEE